MNHNLKVENDVSVDDGRSYIGNGDRHITLNDSVYHHLLENVLRLITLSTLSHNAPPGLSQSSKSVFDPISNRRPYLPASIRI